MLEKYYLYQKQNFVCQCQQQFIRENFISELGTIQKSSMSTEFFSSTMKRRDTTIVLYIRFTRLQENIETLSSLECWTKKYLNI